jgi:hypothetical protein
MTICFAVSVLAQNKNLHSPKEDVRVNREYDEKGNLIKFDSLYTYSWSGDTTMLKSFSPKDFPELFGGNFGFPDSAFNGHSFFDGFDQLFARPFNGTRDSILLKQFEPFLHFKNSHSQNDSTALNFNDLDNFLKEDGKNKNDSILSKSPHNSRGLHQKSMEEMMQMLQLQMQEMEEYQKKFFLKPSK